MNLFLSKFCRLLDKLYVFAIKYNIKPERAGEHIDNKKQQIKNYKLEYFLNDPVADVGTGLIVTRNPDFCFCFTLKQPHRWDKTDKGFPLLPFGGIGGKLEQGESPAASLHREAIEEVGSDVKIAEHSDEIILMDSNSIQKISLTTDLLSEPLPIIIFHSPRAEAGRKSFTNILIYTGRFTSGEIEPIDDPALVEMGAELLLRLAEKPMSIKEFQLAGGKITSKIKLPDDGFLKPIGTAIAVARCLKARAITSKILT